MISKQEDDIDDDGDNDEGDDGSNRGGKQGAVDAGDNPGIIQSTKNIAFTANLVSKSACNNSRPFLVPDSNYDRYQNSFFVRTVFEWNQFHNEIVSLDSVGSFK